MRSILSSVHALDQAVHFVLTNFLSISRWKTDIYESPGCSLEMRSADDVVVCQLQRFSITRLTHTHHLRQAPLQFQEVALQRTTEKQMKFFEICLDSSSLYSLAHSLDPVFLSAGSTDLSLSAQIRSNNFVPANFTLLHWNKFVFTFRMYPRSLFTSGSQHEIIWQIFSIDIVPFSFKI